MTLESVQYFTSRTNNTRDSGQRQAIYLKALEAHCDKLKVHYGRFLSKDRKCKGCGKEYKSFEEKQTDVNMACQILQDAYLDRYDHCYIVSGDSDRVPPVQIVRSDYPDKQVIVACPPRRHSKELNKTANDWFPISKQKLKTSLLPEQVKTSKGLLLTKPKQWKPAQWE